MNILFKKDGDNPSAFEIDDYRATLRLTPLEDRVVSSPLALDAIRCEMKAGTIPIEGSTLTFYKDGSEVLCNFINISNTVQWATTDWDGTCATMHKHMPVTVELDMHLELLMELL